MSDFVLGKPWREPIALGAPSCCDVCGDLGHQTRFLMTEGAPPLELCDQCRKAVDAPKAKKPRQPLWKALLFGTAIGVLLNSPALAFLALRPPIAHAPAMGVVAVPPTGPAAFYQTIVNKGAEFQQPSDYAPASCGTSIAACDQNLWQSAGPEPCMRPFYQLEPEKRP